MKVYVASVEFNKVSILFFIVNENKGLTNHFFLETSSALAPNTKISDAESPVDWDFFNHLFSKSGLRACAVLGSILGPEDEKASRTPREAGMGWGAVWRPRKKLA